MFASSIRKPDSINSSSFHHYWTPLHLSEIVSEWTPPYLFEILTQHQCVLSLFPSHSKYQQLILKHNPSDISHSLQSLRNTKPLPFSLSTYLQTLDLAWFVPLRPSKAQHSLIFGKTSSTSSPLLVQRRKPSPAVPPGHILFALLRHSPSLVASHCDQKGRAPAQWEWLLSFTERGQRAVDSQFVHGPELRQRRSWRVFLSSADKELLVGLEEWRGSIEALSEWGEPLLSGSNLKPRVFAEKVAILRREAFAVDDSHLPSECLVDQLLVQT